MPPSQLFRRSTLGRAFAAGARCCDHIHCQQLYPRQLQNSPFRKYFHDTPGSSIRQSWHGEAPKRPLLSTRSPAPSFASSTVRTRSIPRKFFSPSRRWHSTDSSSKTQSFSQRWRQLSREYGWAALGMYLLLSALDFPFCFAAVRLLGVERIGHYEHVIIESTKRIFEPLWPHTRESESESESESSKNGDNNASGDLAVVGAVEDASYNDHGVVEAQKRNAGEGASIWTQLALAYAIHKSFIFIRVPLTAAVTPKAVRILRRWGWDIGKRKPKTK